MSHSWFNRAAYLKGTELPHGNSQVPAAPPARQHQAALASAGYICLGRPLAHQKFLLPRVQKLGRRGYVLAFNKRPSTTNTIDTTLAWGDAVTLLATEIASERIPLHELGMLCSVLILAWVGVATAKGDYRIKKTHSGFGQVQSQALVSLVTAGTTWALFVPTALATYASMVNHNLIDDSTFLPSGQLWELPAQVEVVVASLWTVSSWRGIYTIVRPYI